MIISRKLDAGPLTMPDERSISASLEISVEFGGGEIDHFEVEVDGLRLDGEPIEEADREAAVQLIEGYVWSRLWGWVTEEERGYYPEPCWMEGV